MPVIDNAELYKPVDDRPTRKESRCRTCGAKVTPPCHLCNVRSGKATADYVAACFVRRLDLSLKSVRLITPRYARFDCEKQFARCRRGVVETSRQAWQERAIPRWPGIVWPDPLDPQPANINRAWDAVAENLSREYPGSLDLEAATWPADPGDAEPCAVPVVGDLPPGVSWNRGRWVQDSGERHIPEAERIARRMQRVRAHVAVISLLANLMRC